MIQELNRSLVVDPLTIQLRSQSYKDIFHLKSSPLFFILIRPVINPNLIKLFLIGFKISIPPPKIKTIGMIKNTAVTVNTATRNQSMILKTESPEISTFFLRLGSLGFLGFLTCLGLLAFLT